MTPTSRPRALRCLVSVRGRGRGRSKSQGRGRARARVRVRERDVAKDPAREQIGGRAPRGLARLGLGYRARLSWHE